MPGTSFKVGMATKVQICNLALRRVSDKTIASLTDTSKTAILCFGMYDQILEEVSISSNWNCAIARAELTENSETPAFEWAHSFALPEDPKCLRVIEMEDPESVFKVEGRNLVTQEATCKIKYIKLVTDPTKLSALFTKAFYLAIAVALSYNLTGSNTVKNGLAQELDDVIREARSIDALEGNPDQPLFSEWLAARVIGTRGRFRGANSGRW